MGGSGSPEGFSCFTDDATMRFGCNHVSGIADIPTTKRPVAARPG
jgi:hypothetical protein